MYSSIRMALPILHLLLSRVRKLAATYEGSVLKEAVNALVKKLERYLDKAEQQQVYFISTILDPRLKLA
jgi:hypothetical protein